MKRTFVEGVSLPTIDEDAAVPRIGLVFLPGDEQPQVTLLEQSNMARHEPHQQDETWRVHTAASLLMEVTFSADLTRLQRYKSDQAKALTINSDFVKIVNNINSGEWDLEGTLIEVSASCLLELLANYRQLTCKDTSDMGVEEALSFLDTIIESVRRFYVRSPVLVRMSTRAHIIKARSIRYGINSSSTFHTLITSQGVKEIISWSTAYYDSIDPMDMKQRRIRPRFLQMLVLLLSLLSDEDLADIDMFIQSTYKLKAGRRHLELSLLKVIPLMSINSKIFLKALATAFGELSIQESYDENEYWDSFVERILQEGYLLPSTILNLGRKEKSWIVKWPEQGLKSTAIFNNLQYAGCICQTINDIPPFKVHPETRLNELVIKLSNDKLYTVGLSSYERLTSLIPGTYEIQEARQGGCSYNLIVCEDLINRNIREAIQKLNAIVQKLSIVSIFIYRTKEDKHLGLKTLEISLPYESKCPGRLIRNIAVLNQETLAVAYKIEGSKITDTHVIVTMMQDIRIMTQLYTHIELQISKIGSEDSEKNVLLDDLAQIKHHIALSKSTLQDITKSDNLPREPISKVLSPSSTDLKSSNIWHDYVTSYQQDDNLLQIKAELSKVTQVTWLSTEIIEVMLAGRSVKFYATPLESIDENAQDDEIRIGDIAILAGKYLIVAEREEQRDENSSPLLMTNYLKIISEENLSSTRGQNRRKLDRQVVSLFR